MSIFTYKHFQHIKNSPLGNAQARLPLRFLALAYSPLISSSSLIFTSGRISLEPRRKLPRQSDSLG